MDAKEDNGGFIEIDLEGEGKAMVAVEALAAKIIAEEKIKNRIIQGKIGKRTQKPIKRRNVW